MDKNTYFSPEFLATLRKQMDSVSPETWHKIMNPMCGHCLVERGSRFVADLNSSRDQH